MSTRQIHISGEVCKGCDVCAFYCPKGALRLSETPNAKGYRIAEAAEVEDCIGCRLCETNCPDLALFVET
jgi:formate hydrogenlyase subunit 6/NADH:ubiquinone oxidoreductase subunit I